MLLQDRLMEILQPGDLLFYSSNGFFGKLIKWKTYSDVTHVAIYVGHGFQREFKEPKGAQEVPFRTQNLMAVYRRYGKWEKAHSDHYWQNVCVGQGYDFIGLLLSFVARKRGHNLRSMFCSEYVVRDDRYAGSEPYLLSHELDADEMAPADVFRSPNKQLVWRISNEQIVDQARGIGYRIWSPVTRWLAA